VASQAQTILVCDDEKNIRRTLCTTLEGEGFATRAAGTAEDALQILGEEPIDLVIMDIMLPGMSGLDAIGAIRKTPEGADLPVIVISGHASIADAVQAMKLGASEVIEKPLNRDLVVLKVQSAVQTSRLAREVKALRAATAKRHDMIGDSPATRKLLGEVDKVAPTKGRVLITGESGTGKELVARAIHKLSPRADGPFIKVNCAAIPAELIESELFGYERGAFTGATGRKRGMFEMADGGTLFLDEIGDMSGSAQAKVLRALQSGEISRVGSETTTQVDVRVLAATNKDLDAEVKAGRFREDLYFRLNVVPIHTPPLRDRKGDIPALAAAFMEEFCKENGFRMKTLGPGVVERLMAHSWPGNVRELKNVVERMVILSGDVITTDDLPEELVVAPSVGAPVTPTPTGARPPLREYKEQMERAYILETLRETEWNISRAAAMLGVERTNLHKKMKAYGIVREG